MVDAANAMLINIEDFLLPNILNMAIIYGDFHILKEGRVKEGLVHIPLAAPL